VLETPEELEKLYEVAVALNKKELAKTIKKMIDQIEKTAYHIMFPNG
jgi:hypothetical protein